MPNCGKKLTPCMHVNIKYRRDFFFFLVKSKIRTRDSDHIISASPPADEPEESDGE